MTRQLTDGERDILNELNNDAYESMSRCHACGLITEGLEDLTDERGDCLNCDLTAERLEDERDTIEAENRTSQNNWEDERVEIEKAWIEEETRMIHSDQEEPF